MQPKTATTDAVIATIVMEISLGDGSSKTIKAISSAVLFKLLFGSKRSGPDHVMYKYKNKMAESPHNCR